MKEQKLKNASLARKSTAVIEAPAQRVGQSAKGKYKFEVRDKDGMVYDSGDWKPNLILDCGLDKLADMAWSQTFQWCVVGTDPTPTVEKFENTRLKVSMDLWNSCNQPLTGFKFPDGRPLECWESDDPPIRVRAVNGCRQAPELPISWDPNKKKNVKNVPDSARGYKRSFGKLTEIGSTLYLRDQDLQFKVIGSCPQYLIEPLQATADVVAVSGYCSTLSALDISNRGIATPNTGRLYTSNTLYDLNKDATITFSDRGLVATHEYRIGQGYLGLSPWSPINPMNSGLNPADYGDPLVIPPGDPTIPLFDEITGAVNTGSGIRVGFPQGRAGKVRAEVSVKNNTTGINESDLEIIDAGDGYGFFDTCDAQNPLEVTFEAPAYDAHLGVWTHDDDNEWNKSIYEGQYTQRYGGILRNSGRYGPINTGNQFVVNHSQTAWTGSMWSTHGNLSNLTKEVYEHCWGDGTEAITTSRFSMGYGKNTNPAGTAHELPTGYAQTAGSYEVMIAQLLLMHFLPFPGPTTHHWYNSPTKIKYVDAQSAGYNAADPATRDSVTYFMTPTYSSTNPGDYINGYPNYFTSQQNLDTTGIKEIMRGCDNSAGLAVGGGAKFSDANDTLFNAIRSQWTNASGLEDAIKNSEMGLIDLLAINNAIAPDDVYIPVNSIRNLGHRHDAYHTNPDGPKATAAGPGGEFMRIIEGNVPFNGAFTIGHFDPVTKYDFYCNRTGGDSYFLYNSNTSTYDGFGMEKNLFHRMGGTAQPAPEIAFSLLTDEDGVVRWLVVNPSRWIAQLISDQTEGQTNQRHRDSINHFIGNMTHGTLYAGNFFQADSVSLIDPPLPYRKPAVGHATTKNCRINSINIDDPGRGYGIKNNPQVVLTGPELERAEIAGLCDTKTGWITGFEVVNPGKGYSCSEPTTIEFPKPPIQEILAWDLLVKPIQTYENINNNYLYQQLDNGIGDDIFQDENCDIYHTQQTYLGQGKSHFHPGTVTNGPRDGGYLSQPDIRCGPCHYVNEFAPGRGNGELYVNGDVSKPGCYTMSETDLYNGVLTNPKPVEYVTHNQYKTHGWYLTGTDVETNSMYCGTDFLTSGNQVVMTRTFDFYMELQPVTYTEIGFKESPAARELFSRIVLDDPIRLRAGQYLRISYQLLLTMEPGPYARFREVPSEGTWVNGKREWVDENTGIRTVTPILSGYECIQGNGIAVVGSDGVSVPYDITGLANEPFAPGTYFFGPQYGYVNRWKNGDTRISYPTKEYNVDLQNPWIHGGDQHMPPDWAIRFFRSPTQNYMPRDFSSFLEWDATEYLTPAANAICHNGWETPQASKQHKPVTWTSIAPGPEYTLERDAFAHWWTPYLPVESGGNSVGHLMWTNFVANDATYQAKNQEIPGRWDLHVTKPYLKEVYPHLMPTGATPNDYNNEETKGPTMFSLNTFDTTYKPTPAWIDKHKNGKFLGTDGINNWYSGRGVFMCPVIEYDGPAGALHDPTTISTGKAGSFLKNPLSHTGGMGLITRASFLAKNPYTGQLFKQMFPNNTGFSGVGFTSYQTGQSLFGGYEWYKSGLTTSKTLGTKPRGNLVLDDTRIKKTGDCCDEYQRSNSRNIGRSYIYDQMGMGTQINGSPGNGRRRGPYCYGVNVPITSEGYALGAFDLQRRQRDFLMGGNLLLDLPTYYPTWAGRGTGGPRRNQGPSELNGWTGVGSYGAAEGFLISPAYGGGYESIASWKTWTHCPAVRTISNWRGGTPVSVPGDLTGKAVAPDTAGNWAGSEVIPVAGCSAFITTANREFAVVGSYQNLSHTVFGAVSGLNGRPTHDFEDNQPISEAAASASGWNGRFISNAEKVGTSGSGMVRCFETPTFLNDYTRGDHRRLKYAEWETSFGNLTGVCAIGLGPTSTTLQPIDMTDSARFNTYVFKFGSPTFAPNRFSNLTTYKLKTTFLHAWYRDLT